MTEAIETNESEPLEIKPEHNSRSIIVGKTGSGKTHLSIHMLKDVKRLVVIDTKDNLADEMNLEPDTKSNWNKFLRGKDIRLQVRPPMASTSDFIPYYERAFRKVFYGSDCVLYIDELYNVTSGGNFLPYYFTSIYTRGRQAKYDKRGNVISGNIGVIACVQRPMHLPQFCMTESEHFFVFQLQSPDDRKRIADFTSPLIKDPIQDEHGFWYYETRSNDPVYVKEL
jgi:hypothetical protein